jgi:hypothetical protein
LGRAAARLFCKKRRAADIWDPAIVDFEEARVDARFLEGYAVNAREKLD